jgi:hypothetical protein
MGRFTEGGGLEDPVTVKGFLDCTHDSPVTCGPTIGFKQGAKDVASAIRKFLR